MTSAAAPPLRPLDQDNFVWSTIEEIGSVQSLHEAPKGATLNDDELWLVNDIPSGAHDLTQRLLIVAHGGRNGHRGMHVMETHVRRLSFISGLTRIVRDFCSKCLLCLHVKGGVVIETELLDHIASQGTLMAVETIVEHRLNPDMQAYEVKVKWLDLETIEDSWEPSKTMCEDVPHILLQFANNGQDDTFVRAVTSTLERKSRHLLKCRST
ncbi:LOW QUALITY PROTEIN: Chromodomain protein [Phytophthora megakarya]|uniref:Chromodomain protein n=1 Tax=Phytophthora megakarya TaxID=4795 RepID=A0A225UAP7_9STRA|nr:LOW QUALITY PROTEIN: Chromodomain protein [Phytophthora megakarya]